MYASHLDRYDPITAFDMNVGLKSFTFELVKHGTFQGYSEWVSDKCYVDTSRSEDDLIYVCIERTVHIYSLSEFREVTRLALAHDESVVACRWYARSQYYITACTQGIIKAWPGRSLLDNDRYMHTNVRSKPVAFAVRVHTGAVTGLELHPTIPGDDKSFPFHVHHVSV